MKAQKTSSSIKVGALTLIALIILIFTVMWIKGRSLSAGERIEVEFKDVNGIRAGSGVQMMGLRVGQIEEIIPIIDGLNSHVKIRFVITEKGVNIPPLSTISIQQSGLVGEQFLEIMPPQVETVYIKTKSIANNIQKDDLIYMDFKGDLKPIAKVEKSDIISVNSLPLKTRASFNVSEVLKLDYTITKSGIFLDNDNLDAKKQNGKIVFYTKNGDTIPYPKEDYKYNIVEPIRMSEFMDLQFKAAKSLSETNSRIGEILTDDLIFELQESAKNMNELTSRAITTVDKAQILLDSSKDDLNTMFKQSNKLVGNLIELSDNVNNLVGDSDFKVNVTNATKSFTRLSDNVSLLLEDAQTKEIMTNLAEISKNMAEITMYVDEFAKDTKLKNDLKQMISGINSATASVNETLKCLNELPEGDKIELKEAIGNILIATRNVKAFSQKLNKRFLLFRLMF